MMCSNQIEKITFMKMDLPEVWKGNRGAFIISRHQIPESNTKLQKSVGLDCLNIFTRMWPTRQLPPQPLSSCCQNSTPNSTGKKHWIYYSWRFQIHTCWYMDLMFLSSNLKSHSLSEELSMACLENEQVEHSLWWIIFQNWQVIPILLGL